MKFLNNYNKKVSIIYINIAHYILINILSTHSTLHMVRLLLS